MTPRQRRLARIRKEAMLLRHLIVRFHNMQHTNGRIADLTRLHYLVRLALKAK